MHAVSLMEVGEENGEKYVLARTSHGMKFGDDGHIKISLEKVLTRTLRNILASQDHLLEGSTIQGY